MTEYRSEPTPPSEILDLSDLESKVIDAARRGAQLTCTPIVDIDELSGSDNPAHRVRAELIRELLLGRHGELDPRGIRLSNFRIVGTLDLDHLRTTTPLSLKHCSILDTVTAHNARLNQVDLTGSQLAELHADGLHVDGTLTLWEIRVRSDDTRGAVRLAGARISGSLDLDHAEVVNTAGCALQLNKIHINNTLYLRQARVNGVGKGAIRLISAYIGGSVELDGSEITNENGCALHLNRITVDGTLFLREARVRGSGHDGAVRLVGAQIIGSLNCAKLQVHNTTGPVLHLGKAHVRDTTRIPAKVVCPDSSLGDACGNPTKVDLTEFTFTTLAWVDWRQWLHLVTHHTKNYQPQPYQQLAAIERGLGHDGNARQVLIAQQDDRRLRDPSAIGGRWTRLAHWAWGRLAGYGYHARTLASALLLALVAAGATGFVAGQVTTRPGHHAAERVTPPGTSAVAPGTPCSTVELIGLGLDRGLPLGATGLRAKCDLDTSTLRGGAFTLVIWLIQAMLWGLITLAVAGYTALIRKTA